MKVSVSIDDDLLAAARSLARVRSQSLGRVLSDLIRRGLGASTCLGKEEINGFPVFRVPPKARPITLHVVKKHEDEV